MDLIKISIIFVHQSQGKLGLSQCPGKNLQQGRDGKAHVRDIRSDISSFKDRGVNAIVCLLNDPELRSIGVHPEKYKEAASFCDITFIQYPILEMAAPETVESVEAAVLRPVCDYILSGKFVVLHCRGGIGRAGTIAACMLKKMNLESNYALAIKYIRKKRDKRCIESRKQEDFVKSYFKALT
jgi:cyclin-dependent kinase inhibitor 3